MATPSPDESLDKAVERLQEVAKEAVCLAAKIRRRTRYSGFTVQPAILKYLKSQDIPRSESHIAEELLEGGVATTASDFNFLVSNTLRRLRHDDRIHWSRTGYAFGPSPPPGQPNLAALRTLRSNPGPSGE